MTGERTRSGGRRARGAGGGRANAARRPLLAALAGLLVASPLIPSEAAAQHGAGLPISLAAIALLGGWAAAGLAAGRLAVRWDGPSVVLVLLAAWHWLSTWVTGPHGALRPALNLSWQWTGYAALFLLLRHLLRSNRERRAVMAVMVGLAVCASAHGLYQFAYSMPETVRRYWQDPEAVLAQYGLDPRPDSPERKHFEDRLGSREPYATFALPNSLAGFLAPWLIAAGGVAFSARANRRRVCSGAAVSALLIAACLLLTKSRTAWLAAGAGVGGLLASGSLRAPGSPPGARRLLAAGGSLAALGLLVAAVAAAGGLDRLVVTEAGKSLGYRLQYWRAAARMTADRPWFGCGPGRFQRWYGAYQPAEASETVAEPHNVVLELAATAGAPAAALLLVMLAWTARLAWTEREEEAEGGGEPGESGAAWVYGGALAGLVFAYPIGWIVGFPQELGGMAIGAAAGAACLALLHGWVDQGGGVQRLALVCGGVLTLNFMAAGALAFAGVAQSLGWLAALAAGDGGRWRQLSRRGAAAVLAAALALLAAAYATALLPAVRAPRWLAQARAWEREGRFPEAARAYRRAAAADPYDAAPWRGLAALAMAEYLQTRNGDALAAFERLAGEAVRRDPRSRALACDLGDWRFRAYRHGAGRGQLEAAIAAYRRAVRLHPENNFSWAQLAWTLHVAGRRAEARDAARRALALDRRTPHPELRLAARQVYDGGHPLERPRPLGADNARQLMERLAAGGPEQHGQAGEDRGRRGGGSHPGEEKSGGRDEQLGGCTNADAGASGGRVEPLLGRVPRSPPLFPV